MTNEVALLLAIGAGALAIIFGIVSTQWILKQPAGNDRMQEIALAIQEGAGAYMNRQYQAIGIVGVVLFVALGLALGWHTAGGFAIGAIFPVWRATLACSFLFEPTCAQRKLQRLA